MTLVGFPHSEISGSKPARGSPELFAACCVLHRFPAPRHPPHALSSLTSTFKNPQWCRATGSAFKRVSQLTTRTPDCQRSALGSRPKRSWRERGLGGGKRVRTADLLLAKQALSQLSYAPETACRLIAFRLVGLGRFELPTSRLSGVRSNQLSYRPAPAGRG